MRNYGKVAPTFWTRGSGRKLRGKPFAQVVALYLMTCGQGSLCGVFPCPKVFICHETGLSAGEVDEAFEWLSEVGLAYIDEEAELVWVPGTALHQVGAALKPTDKRAIAIRNELERAGAHPFARAFWDRYGAAYSLGPMPDELCGVEAPCGPPSDTLRSQNKTKQSKSNTGQPHAPSEGTGAPADKQPDKRTNSGGEKKKATGGTRSRRAPLSLVPLEWRPPDKEMAAAADLGLDAEAILRDFVDYWRGEGKMKADWAATFRNNVSNINRTEHLRRKYVMATPLAAPPDPPKHGPPVPPPPGMLERMRRFGRGETEHLEPRPTSDPPPAAEGTG